MLRGLPLLLSCLLVALAARATPLSWDLQLNVPPVIHDSTKPPQCTVTWLVDDIAMNDVYAVRMQIAPTENAQPIDGRMPCPAQVPPRIAARALDVCASRAADPRSCVFADMSRGFEREPDPRNTAENASRCASDRAREIGLACWTAPNGLQVCNVGCGMTSMAAAAAARQRCAEKHERSCDIVGAVPVLAPQ